jgi:hypothetical protein
MAIGVELEFNGATVDQYDAVVQKMGFTPGGPGGPGGIFHVCTKTDNGIRVIDVWESQEAFEKFAQEKIGPLSADVGMPGPPKVKFFDVHNYLVGSS